MTKLFLTPFVVALTLWSLGPSTTHGGESTLAQEESRDITLRVDGESLKKLPSIWADYFGTHYARSADQAGAVWNTVRSYGGTHVGFYPTENSKPRKGPFTGKEIRISLADLHARRGAGKRGEGLLDDIVKHQFSAIYLTTNIVRPSLETFDKDLAYWGVRLVHETYPDAYGYVAWQVGNEVVSGHFDPRGLRREGRVRAGLSPDGKFFGYDLDWKEGFYVNHYLAPAVEAIERASYDVYGDARKITILLGSMNPYNRPNIEFLSNVMNRKFDGVHAPSLTGQSVWKHIDVLTVHYMTGSDENVARLQEYHDRYLKTGKVKGIWITEDHGRVGQGTVTVVERGFRFLAWVARNDLSGQQTRLVWWGDNAPKPGGSAREAAELLSRFLGGRSLFLMDRKIDGGHIYAIADSDEGPSRILVAIVPSLSSEISLDRLHLSLAKGAADRSWRARVVQYSATTRPVNSEPKTMSKAGTIEIALNKNFHEPWLLMLTATGQPSAASNLIERIRANDKNGDGEITNQEASKVLKRFFDRIDANRDGVIDTEELTKVPVQSLDPLLGAQRRPQQLAGRQDSAQSPKAIEISDAISPIEVMQVKADDGNTIDVALRKPPGKGPFPAIVLLHGGMSEVPIERRVRQSREGLLATRLLQRGFVVAISTFRTYADNSRDPGPIEDNVAVIDFLKKRQDVDHDSVVVLGNSGGGRLALELSGLGERTGLAAIVCAEPATTLYAEMYPVGRRGPDMEVSRNYQKYFGQPQAAVLKEKVAKLSCPVLINHGEVHHINLVNNELLVPEIRKQNKELRTKFYPGQSHAFIWGRGPKMTEEIFHRVVDDVVDFCRDYVKVQPKPMAELP